MGAVPLSRRRRVGIAGEVAGVIRLAFEAGEISSLFGLEGVLRASLRSDLCLRGWHWHEAQRAAADIVNVAHGLLGAERPSWNEGQADFVTAGGTLIERTRCKTCHKAMPEGHLKYCSKGCASADHHRIASRRNAAADEYAGQAVSLARAG
jgi:hypothetical protein